MRFINSILVYEELLFWLLGFVISQQLLRPAAYEHSGFLPRATCHKGVPGGKKVISCTLNKFSLAANNKINICLHDSLINTKIKILHIGTHG